MSQQDLEYARSLLVWVDDNIKHNHHVNLETMSIYTQIANTWAYIASCDNPGPGGSV